MANDIHPTAIVDPAAELGDGLVIGPYCVIGAGRAARRRLPPPQSCDLGRTERDRDGERVLSLRLDRAAVAGPEIRRRADLPEDRGWQHLPRVLHINRGTAPSPTPSSAATAISSPTATSPTTASWETTSFSRTTAPSPATSPWAITPSWADSPPCTISQLCRIGAHAITGGCSKIVQDVPPYMIADGNPGKVRAVNTVASAGAASPRRPSPSSRRPTASSTASSALPRIARDPPHWPERGPEIDLLIDFVASSERGSAEARSEFD